MPSKHALLGRELARQLDLELPCDVSKLARYDKVLVIAQLLGVAMYHEILESAIKLGDACESPVTARLTAVGYGRLKGAFTQRSTG